VGGDERLMTRRVNEVVGIATGSTACKIGRVLSVTLEEKGGVR